MFQSHSCSECFEQCTSKCLECNILICSKCFEHHHSSHNLLILQNKSNKQFKKVLQLLESDVSKGFKLLETMAESFSIVQSCLSHGLIDGLFTRLLKKRDLIIFHFLTSMGVVSSLFESPLIFNRTNGTRLLRALIECIKGPIETKKDIFIVSVSCHIYANIRCFSEAPFLLFSTEMINFIVIELLQSTNKQIKTQAIRLLINQMSILYLILGVLMEYVENDQCNDRVNQVILESFCLPFNHKQDLVFEILLKQRHDSTLSEQSWIDINNLFKYLCVHDMCAQALCCHRLSPRLLLSLSLRKNRFYLDRELSCRIQMMIGARLNPAMSEGKMNKSNQSRYIPSFIKRSQWLDLVSSGFLNATDSKISFIFLILVLFVKGIDRLEWYQRGVITSIARECDRKAEGTEEIVKSLQDVFMIESVRPDPVAVHCLLVSFQTVVPAIPEIDYDQTDLPENMLRVLRGSMDLSKDVSNPSSFVPATRYQCRKTRDLVKAKAEKDVGNTFYQK